MALLTEAWRGVEICRRLVVNGYFDLPGPILKIVNNCLNTNIYSYLETSGGQSSNLYLNVVHYSAPVLIRHLW